MDRWRKVCGGQGQIVIMSGEAGIGKSRILAALREAIGIDPRNVWRYQCQPHRGRACAGSSDRRRTNTGSA